MRWWEVALLGGFGLTVVGSTAVLCMTRGDRSEWAKEKRQQAVGMMLLTSVVPVWLLLERRMRFFPYAVVLGLVVVSGVALYLRGGGWRGADKP